SSLVALGFASSFAWVLLLLVVVNAVGGLSDILSQSLIQLSAPSGRRGRAGGAWVVAIGTAPLGQLQVGALASLLGVSVALGASGVGLILITAGAGRPSPPPRRGASAAPAGRAVGRGRRGGGGGGGAPAAPPRPPPAGRRSPPRGCGAPPPGGGPPPPPGGGGGGGFSRPPPEVL